ncbi:MAG: APC family permease [Steroidobacteraceae bacterium]
MTKFVTKPLAVTPETRLKGNMGTASLMLIVLAFAAPITSVTSIIPITIIFGGMGATAAVLITTVLVLIFSVGFVAMTRQIDRPGAFYSYVTAGLGKTIGLGGAFLTTASYYLALVGAYALDGVLTSNMIVSFGGPDTPWFIWSGLAWIIASVLGYFHIEMSARVLVGAMILEITIILVFGLWTFASKGAAGLPLQPLTPKALFQGNLPITMLFCILMFLGFEATAVFRDEVHAPTRTIPRATYGAVLVIGLLYALSSYCLVMVYGSDAISAAKTNPTTMFPHAIGTIIAPIFVQIVSTVVVLSQFASALSVHNVVTRYVHRLAADGALPRYFASVHSKHNSPHRASMLIAVLVAAALAPFALRKAQPGLLYGQLMGIGLLGLLVVMALVSLAVIAWFFRHRRLETVSVWHTYIAPAIAFIGIGGIAVMAFLNFNLVFGSQSTQNALLFSLIAFAFIAGLVTATYFRCYKTLTYEALGGALRGESSPAE